MSSPTENTLLDLIGDMLASHVCPFPENCPGIDRPYDEGRTCVPCQILLEIKKCPKVAEQEDVKIATIEVVGDPQGQPKHGVKAVPVPLTKVAPGLYRKWRAMSHPVTSIKNRDGSRKAHPIVLWRKLIVLSAKRDCVYRTIGVAIRVEREFRFRRPNCHWGTGRNAGKLKKSAPKYHIVKPDGDNLTKPVFDSLKDAGIITDDCIIVRGEPHKRYCQFGPDGVLEPPGCTITIWKLED